VREDGVYKHNIVKRRKVMAKQEGSNREDGKSWVGQHEERRLSPSFHSVTNEDEWRQILKEEP